ncbi:UDP-2,4-diacetamido-2,4,6-trideoxy-beta-L-altropyranose hydrolase [Lysinibacillus sp. NPDC056185]|uniref:UDP-2,4-diacetamido-2,4, 6-trideoxy-beta-L-altropyranose hydrolase n=1 Tax=Lysinibacillus sp. NPDC056185 TaxID=3345739 RepID=UPI0039EDE9AD
MKNICFKVDASIQIGSGHVMRCITLANQLKDKGMNITFITRDLKGNMNKYIAKHFSIRVLPKIEIEDSWQWISDNWQQDVVETIDVLDGMVFDLFVVDHYAIDFKWEKRIRPYTREIMVIDDLANREHDCDILLDQNFYSNMNDRYNKLVPKHCKKYLGPNNALLREEFIKEVYLNYNKNNNILISFGGSDPTGETLKVCKLLKNIIPNKYIITIIIGSSNPEKLLIERFCELNNQFTSYFNVTNMARLINESSFCIGGGGVSVIERCVLKKPTLIITVAENQIEIAKDIQQIGAANYIGHYNENYEEVFKDSILKFVKDDLYISNMSNKCREIIDVNVLEKKELINYITSII